MFVSRTTRTRKFGARRGTPVIALGMVFATAVGVAVTGTASAATTPTVSLTVNGQTSTVTTNASTVAGLLNDEDVRFDDNDLLTPGPAVRISNGLDVELTRAVHITVRDHGKRYNKLVTVGSVNHARAELNLPTGKRRATSRFEAYSFEWTGVYGPHGKTLSGTDRVLEDSVAVVHDVRVAFPSDRFRVKANVERDRSKLVRAGGTRVYQQGHNGIKHVTWRKRYVDGKLASKKAAQSRWIKSPQRKIVRVGTGPNWIGLARCESGGNPNAVNPSGFYGLYQFSLSTWHAVGGRGNPTDYGYWEQTKRAWILYHGSGRSPWPVCGRHL
ncbi:MAG TPA: transglycosylase family protein [Actinomycetes bacterium]|nr:transglycosylase family protein [Actinomycetes bacterium]